MECPKCQINNRDGAIFCRKCGASFKTDILCPNCEALNLPDSSFCEKCGKNLTSPHKVLSSEYLIPQTYTPKHLADKILSARSSIEGERKLLTVLFADVANYTTMAEKLDPEKVHQIMDGCFNILLDETHAYEGTVNQFTGDGIMAIFGAPVAHEDHAQRACWCALAMKKALNNYNDKLNKEFGIDFKMRIGINSGPVVVGSIGDNLRMDYTAIGDTSNLAARMEHMAPPGSIFVSKNTYVIAKNFFEFAPLGKFEIKGKKMLQEAFELINAEEFKTRFKSLTAKNLTNFIGRKNSMTALKEPFDRVISDLGQAVGIVGEAGVGKSRLLMEFVDRMPKENFTYLEGRCLRYGETVIYMPVLEILKSYFEIKDKDSDSIKNRKIESKIKQLDQEFDSIIPAIQELLLQKAEDKSFLALNPKQKREKTFESLRDLFIRESQNKPLLIVIEDVHWIDKTSEEFLNYLIEWIVYARIMLIILYRPEYNHSWNNKSYYTNIGLTHLRENSSTQMVKAILKQKQISKEIKQLILNRSAGNPLFMEEFTFSLIEGGIIEKKGKRFVLTAKTSDIEVPDTIQGIIAARIDRLEENLKRLIQIASVIGREFTFNLLKSIKSEQRQLKSHLLNLQGLEFLYEKSLFPELNYIFKHALTQEVAYGSLLLKERKKIHCKIGNSIEKLYNEKIEEFYEILAFHYSKSGEPEKAFKYLKLSGDKAVEKFSNWEAFRFYKSALKMLDKTKDDIKSKERKLVILNLMAIPMRLLGYPENSLQLLERGEKLSQELKDLKNISLFLGCLGSYHSIRGGDPLLGIRYSEKSINEAEKIEDIEIIAPVSSRLCAFYIIAGEPLKTATLAPKAIKMIETHKRQKDFFSLGNSAYSALNMYYGHSLGWLGQFEKGESQCKKGLKFGLRIDSLTGLALAEFLFGYFYMHKGDGENVKKHFQECIKYCEEGDALIWLGLAWTGFGIGYFFVGEFDEALKYIKQGMKIQKEAGIPYYMSFHYFALGMVQLEIGDLKRSTRNFKKALELSNKHNEKWIEGTSRIYAGAADAKNDKSKIKSAEKNILDGIKILEKRKIKPWASVGYHNLGMIHSEKPGIANEYLKKANSMFNKMQMEYWVIKTEHLL
jgi:class 3 adenylate cyclase/tetratricopeptide (TPR) repeat protein